MEGEKLIKDFRGENNIQITKPHHHENNTMLSFLFKQGMKRRKREREREIKSEKETQLTT